MNVNVTAVNWNAVFVSLIGGLTAGLLAAYWAGWKLPLITTDRAAGLAVAGLGFLMCTLGMRQIPVGLGWGHPISIAGSVLGVLILGLAAALMAGWRLPVLANDRAVVMAVAVLGLVKWGLGVYSHWVLKV